MLNPRRVPTIKDIQARGKRLFKPIKSQDGTGLKVVLKAWQPGVESQPASAASSPVKPKRPGRRVDAPGSAKKPPGFRKTDNPLPPYARNPRRVPGIADIERRSRQLFGPLKGPPESAQQIRIGSVKALTRSRSASSVAAYLSRQAEQQRLGPHERRMQWRIDSQYFQLRRAVFSDTRLNRQDKAQMLSVLSFERLKAHHFIQNSQHDQEVSLMGSAEIRKLITEEKEDPGFSIGGAPSPEPEGIRLRVKRILDNLSRQIDPESKTERDRELNAKDLYTRKARFSQNVHYLDKKTDKTLFVDTGKVIAMRRTGITEAGVAVALQLAKERFGSTLTINGSADFKKLVIEATAKSGMDIHFTDKAMNEGLAARRAELEIEKEGQSIQPAPAKNDVPEQAGTQVGTTQGRSNNQGEGLTLSQVLWVKTQPWFVANGQDEDGGHYVVVQKEDRGSSTTDSRMSGRFTFRSFEHLSAWATLHNLPRVEIQEQAQAVAQSPMSTPAAPVVPLEDRIDLKSFVAEGGVVIWTAWDKATGGSPEGTVIGNYGPDSEPAVLSEEAALARALADLSKAQNAQATHVQEAAVQAPAKTADVPEPPVAASALLKPDQLSRFIDDRSREPRELTDRLSLTPLIEAMYGEGKTAEEISRSIGSALDAGGVNPQERITFISRVADSLGVPGPGINGGGIGALAHWQQQRGKPSQAHGYDLSSESPSELIRREVAWRNGDLNLSDQDVRNSSAVMQLRGEAHAMWVIGTSDSTPEGNAMLKAYMENDSYREAFKATIEKVYDQYQDAPEAIKTLDGLTAAAVEIVNKVEGRDIAPAASEKASQVPAAANRKLIKGVLVSHGTAPYQHKPDNQQSYFATVKTETGERTVWGVGLAEALHGADFKQGDFVQLEDHGTKPVTVEKVAEDGQTVEKTTYRREWTAQHVQPEMALATSVAPVAHDPSEPEQDPGLDMD